MTLCSGTITSSQSRCSRVENRGKTWLAGCRTGCVRGGVFERRRRGGLEKGVRRFEGGIVAVSSAEEAAASTVEGSDVSKPQEWYALLANAEFMLNDVQNEPLAEQLRERTRFFAEKNREIDFYLVPEPLWLDKKYPEEAKLIGRPCVALVTTDKIWTTFMKLRLDQVLRIDLGAVPAEEVLQVGAVIPPFEKPAKWTAPYPKYSSGWWDAFLPENTEA